MVTPRSGPGVGRFVLGTDGSEVTIGGRGGVTLCVTHAECYIDGPADFDGERARVVIECAHPVALDFGEGADVARLSWPPPVVYEPDHPCADSDGYVQGHHLADAIGGGDGHTRTDEGPA